MDGFFSFLLFAGLFYVMMRFGCGAHMVHGHRHKNRSADSNGDKHVDVVCGKELSPTEGYGKMDADRLYRFCSRQCLDIFEANPDRYRMKLLEVKP